MRHHTSWTRLLGRLHRDHEGSAMTEFTAFLPIWLVLFIGIVNLGKLGWGTTAGQIEAQLKLWDSMAGQVDYEDTLGTEYVNPFTGGIQAGKKSIKSRPAYSDANNTANQFESVTWAGAMGVNGHWGESYQRTKILDGLSVADLGDGPYLKVNDLLEDANDYPSSLVDDTKTGVDKPSKSVASILSELIQASGSIAAVGAGNRYGVVMSEVVDKNIPLSGWSDVKTNARYDALTPPAAMQGFKADRVPFALARLIAEGDPTENSKVMLDFGGDPGWTNQKSDPDDFSYDQDKGKDEGEEQAEEECENAGFSSNSKCKKCRDAGYSSQSACQACEDDPNCSV